MTNFEYLPKELEALVKDIINELDGATQAPSNPNPINKKDEIKFDGGPTYEIDKNKLRMYINNNFKFNFHSEIEWLVSIAKCCNANIQVLYEYVIFMYSNYRDELPPHLYNNWVNGTPSKTSLNSAVMVAKYVIG